MCTKATESMGKRTSQGRDKDWLSREMAKEVVVDIRGRNKRKRNLGKWQKGSVGRSMDDVTGGHESKRQ